MLPEDFVRSRSRGAVLVVAVGGMRVVSSVFGKRKTLYFIFRWWNASRFAVVIAGGVCQESITGFMLVAAIACRVSFDGLC